MKAEAKPTMIYATLWILNFNPEGNVGHTHTGILNREITESYLNFIPSLCPPVKDGLEGGLWMTGKCAIEARKLCGRIYIEVLRIFIFG